MDLRETGWEVVDKIHLASGGDQWSSCENSNEPSGSIKGGDFVD
jgi:hypothetical protein